MNQLAGEDHVAKLLYSSKATCPFSEKDLHALLDQAARSNRIHGITGFLYYKAGVFFQYIEGDRSELDRLMEKIRRDERHEVANEVWLEGLPPERLFRGWGMQFLRPADYPEILAEDALSDLVYGIRPSIYSKERLEKLLNPFIKLLSNASEKGRLFTK